MKAKLYILSFLLFVSFAYVYSHELCSNGKTYLSMQDSAVFDLTYDVKYYNLNLRITTNPNFLYGAAQVKGVLNDAGTSIFLNLSNALFVDSVTGVGVSSFSHSNDKLNIFFSQSLTSFDVKIYYKGLPSGTGFGSFVFASQNSYPVIWSLSEPYGASD